MNKKPIPHCRKFRCCKASTPAKANISCASGAASKCGERNRTANLVKSDAATRKQLDDANGNIDVIQKQIQAAQTQLLTVNQQISAAKENIAIQNRAILSEKNPTEKKVAQIDEQLKHNIISTPISGTVLTKYANKGELATIGKPFQNGGFELMTLRAYITGDQIPQRKLNPVRKKFSWIQATENQRTSRNSLLISLDAEFTPKTIQTKNERANLVYATKNSCEMTGFLKIGMYGEVRF